MLQAVIMVGLMNSGKSTFIQKNLTNFVVIGFDSSLELYYPYLETYNERYDAWYESKNDGGWTKLRDFTLNRLIWAVIERKNIVIDETNLTEKRRTFWEQKLSALGIDKVTYIEFDTSIDEVLSRADREGKIIPESAIRRANDSREPIVRKPNRTIKKAK